MEPSRTISTLIQNLQMTRVLMIVSVVFVTMWAPFFIFLLWCTTKDYYDNQFSCNAANHEKYAAPLSGLGMCNSFVNVILYSVSWKHCRKEWKDILLCRKNKVAPLQISLNATAGISKLSIPQPPINVNGVEANTIWYHCIHMVADQCSRMTVKYKCKYECKIYK